MKLKYIRTVYGPVIFPETLTHSDVAKGLPEVKSAGFLYVDYNVIEDRFDIKPFGESISLDIKSDPEIDKKHLDNLFNS